MYRIAEFARGAPLRFTFDGQPVTGFEKESLAGAILSSGHTVLSRSLRFHRPRAVFCSTGECGRCALEVDGTPNVHACVLQCREGMQVRSQNRWPSAGHDIFSLLDLLSPWLPNSFYHHRLLRPRFMRQFYLRALRHFTGSGRLGADIKYPPARRKVSIATDVVVIGGGPSGLSAAVTAAEYGARVVLIDDHDTPGGSWRTRADAPEALRILSEKITTLPSLQYWPNSTCIGIYPKRILGVITPDQLVSLSARQIILAPGARDALALFANNDIPGVLSARLVEKLITAEGILPGRRAVVWGTGAAAERIQTIMQRAGIRDIHVLQDGDSIISVKGKIVVNAAIIRDAAGGRRTVPCDLIVIAATEARNELLAEAGGQLRWDEEAGAFSAQRNALMETSIPGLRVVGEAAGPADARRCLAEGQLAGLSAAKQLGFAAAQDETQSLVDEIAKMDRGPVIRFPSESSSGAAHICFCEDVREREIRAQIAAGYTLPELVKRRTGVFTGPCQGKFCMSNTMRITGESAGCTTARPPAKPVRLKDLLAE